MGTDSYNKALKKIETARQTGATKLDLSLCQLKNLPPEIFDLTQLTDLILRDNDIQNLPSELSALTKLVTLNLANNYLTVLPLEIGDLTNAPSTLKRNICARL